MSATLRHDISPELAHEIVSLSTVLNDLGAYETQRWGGRPRGHYTAWTFSLKLPKQIGLGHDLLTCLNVVRLTSKNNRQCRPAHTLAAKLTVSFGLPYNEFLGPICSEEKGFLKSVNETPEDLTTWSAYSDWLVEHNDPRGTVIAEWLDPKKAMKVKYGIPVAVRHKLGLG